VSCAPQPRKRAPDGSEQPIWPPIRLGLADAELRAGPHQSAFRPLWLAGRPKADGRLSASFGHVRFAPWSDTGGRFAASRNRTSIVAAQMLRAVLL
jgi:hypothetical protein